MEIGGREYRGIDFRRMADGSVVVLFWGQERGEVRRETSDRLYFVSERYNYDEAHATIEGDTLAEAVAWLVPEHREDLGC